MSGAQPALAGKDARLFWNFEDGQISGLLPNDRELRSTKDLHTADGDPVCSGTESERGRKGRFALQNQNAFGSTGATPAPAGATTTRALSTGPAAKPSDERIAGHGPGSGPMTR
ncbi:MAG TPA: hypothetical protein VEV85_22775 [Bryobacteraceae bacterium]|nr:hypothetical protein [Bryobacteraceae bacterium]